jgi:hypothetical protein
MEHNGNVALGWTIILLVAAFVLYLQIVPVKMANRRGRSAFFWFLMGLILSPFAAMVLLYFLSETDTKREERIIDEEQIRMRYRNL